MELSELKNEVHQYNVGKLRDLLDCNVKAVTLLCRPAELGKLLSSYGTSFTQGYSNDFECNGWQWDYWVSFKYEGKVYKVSGNGYHTNEMKIQEFEE